MTGSRLLLCGLSAALGFGPLAADARSMAASVLHETSLSKQVADDPELEAKVREVTAKLRCPTCRALSVQDSPSGLALEMRELVREQLAAGKTTDEVLAYFVDRYGEWILLEPKAEGFNWTVWLLPVFLLLGGLAFVWITARRWVQVGQARAAALVEEGQRKDG